MELVAETEVFRHLLRKRFVGGGGGRVLRLPERGEQKLEQRRQLSLPDALLS